MTSTRHIYSVSELNNDVRRTLEQGLGLIWLEAEISSLARPASGHWYFSLKDNHAQIRCAFFKQRNRLVNFPVEEGQKVLVRGKVSLYEPRGDYQLIVEHLELAGEGDLQRQFEALKRRLREEGLFDEPLKKPLPAFPKTIGIITSPSGAAIRDILHVVNRRYPSGHMIIYPSMVQGEGAAAALTIALKTADRRAECDVLLISRGGGSLEDLWAFNDEQLARAIFACGTPVVSGVGHEIDFTICDFVADVRAPTPSAAAEIITPDIRELTTAVARCHHQLYEIQQRRLQHWQQKLDWTQQRLTRLHPGTRIEVQQEQFRRLYERLKNAQSTLIHRLKTQHKHMALRLWQQSPVQQVQQKQSHLEMNRLRLTRQMKRILDSKQQHLAASAQTLHTLSPLATLSRGYSITRIKGSRAPLTDVHQINMDELLETQLHNGTLVSRVEKITS